jgi:hypothetical protein
MPICSSPYCCGNPRGHQGGTRQEKQWATALEEQLKEYEEEKADPHIMALLELGWF